MKLRDFTYAQIPPPFIAPPYTSSILLLNQFNRVIMFNYFLPWIFPLLSLVSGLLRLVN